jgi:tetratricopeptide (TPR) repeat protein
MTQNNLGAALWGLAGSLAGEERQARLDEAVAAYREALVFRTAERAPMDYAMTQNNLGAALRGLAGSLAGEERQARLDEAVAAYREALVFYTAERAPMDYAMTQTNLQKALKDLGTDAGTTRRLAPVRREGRGRVWRWLR